VEISSIKAEEHSAVISQSLSEIKLRNITGATLLALKREKTIYEHPRPKIIFQPGDIVYLMGNPEQIAKAEELFSNSEEIENPNR